ncbi:aspartic-type endopeptidase [Aureococcus anophagefferens]|uniref:Aspartic-type endopeptidase n=2 Tax=Aureococcus anophagefferens TaxID=44056 RepID=A0ABR1FZ19_AURAN|nr:hypothetical protein AURANDRAFT_62572 [Aureococcus anophagefferens]EGB10047.1 hypothetical protein AURANDRAFT_62572 [Aureococcus anophagefferens]|eukprot:XP_009034884.1 hypothetical protein AURANDRAFT_62572 [Aureococcus anophagefferens]
MAPALSVLLSSVAVAAAAPSGGKKMVTKAMRPRGRTLKAEAIGRVKKFNDHASRLTGKTFSSVASTKAAEASSTSPNREMQSYWDYPMTLDYVVDIAVAANSSAKYSEYQVIVDTGSSNLAISLESCSCGEGSSDLDVSIDEDECIEVTYGSGAWSGYETATLSVGFVEGAGPDGVIVDDTTIAGIASQTDFFEGGGYNGILGLGYSDLSEPYSASECSSSSGMSGGGGMGGGGMSGGGGGGDMGGGGQMGGGGMQGGHKKSTGRSSGRSSQQGGMGGQQQQGGMGAPAPGPGRKLEETAATPLLDVFYEDGLLNENVFTLAFCSNTASFAIGGVDESVLESNITYVDVQETYGYFYGYYLVYLEGVAVDGVDVSGVSASSLNELGGVLVDSGTTLVYLPSTMTSKIEADVQSAAGSSVASNRFFEMESCVSADDLDSFPTITLELSGYDLKLEPTEYTLKYDDCYYWGIMSSDVGIIGNIALQNKMIVFDRDNNKVGFAKTDCGPGQATTKSSSTSSASKKAERQAARSPANAPAMLNAVRGVEKSNIFTSFSALSGLVVVAALLAVVAAKRQSAYEPIPVEEEV